MIREELLSNAKPILFNTDMVRAILDGRKTVTRRLMKLPANDHLEVDTDGSIIGIFNQYEGAVIDEMAYAPYQPRDILYVRETWGEGYHGYIYKADDKLVDLPEFKESSKMIYRPSIHMPKDAARIFLRVTDVHAERLQDMPHDAALKEGIHFCECPDGYTWKSSTNMYNCYITPMGAMKELWNSVIKKSDLGRYGWHTNPYVWVIEFEKISKEEAHDRTD